MPREEGAQGVTSLLLPLLAFRPGYYILPLSPIISPLKTFQPPAWLKALQIPAKERNSNFTQLKQRRKPVTDQKLKIIR